PPTEASTPRRRLRRAAGGPAEPNGSGFPTAIKPGCKSRAWPGRRLGNDWPHRSPHRLPAVVGPGLDGPFLQTTVSSAVTRRQYTTFWYYRPRLRQYGAIQADATFLLCRESP